MGGVMGRKDPEKHKEQVRRANRARYKADVALRERYPDDYEALYAEFAAAEGVEPSGPRPRREHEVKTAVTEAAAEAQAAVAAGEPVGEPEPLVASVAPKDPFGPLSPVEKAQADAEARREALRKELEPALDD